MTENLRADSLASASAGLIARVICHPIDTCKTKLQVADNLSGISQAMRMTWKQEGIAGFYRGLSIVALGSVPGVCLYITSYERSKAFLISKTNVENKLWAYLVSGIVAEILCCTVFIPVDVVKERLQVQANRNGYRYKGSFDALRTIIKREGLAGLYKGYNATVFSYAPFSAIYFSLYEESRKRLSSIRCVDVSALGFQDNLISSAIAGSIASLATNPLDVGKIRFQVQEKQAIGVQTQGETVYRNMYHAMMDIYQKNGIKGLFRGSLVRAFFHTPSTAITMALFEECKRLWSIVI